MSLISIVFQCWRRPEITKRVLKRLVEMMKEDYEIVLMYDEADENYLGELRRIYPFETEVINPGRKKTIGKLWDEAYLACKGKYFAHYQNDWLWLRGDCYRIGKIALEKLGMGYVKLGQQPFHRNQFKSFHKIEDYEIGIYKKWGQGGPSYQWSMNPFIQKERFPCGIRFSGQQTLGGMENYGKDVWNRSNKIAGAIMGRGFFEHLGVTKETSARIIPGSRVSHP